MATTKQIAYAESLAKQAGFRGVSDALKAQRGKHPVGWGSVADYSALITWLQGRVGPSQPRRTTAPRSSSGGSARPEASWDGVYGSPSYYSSGMYDADS